MGDVVGCCGLLIQGCVRGCWVVAFVPSVKRTVAQPTRLKQHKVQSEHTRRPHEKTKEQTQNKRQHAGKIRDEEPTAAHAGRTRNNNKRTASDGGQRLFVRARLGVFLLVIRQQKAATHNARCPDDNNGTSTFRLVGWLVGWLVVGCCGAVLFVCLFGGLVLAGGLRFAWLIHSFVRRTKQAKPSSPTMEKELSRSVLKRSKIDTKRLSQCCLSLFVTQWLTMNCNMTPLRSYVEE